MILSIVLRIVGVALLVLAGIVSVCSLSSFFQAYSSARLNDSVNFGVIGGVFLAFVGTVLAMAGVLSYRRGVERRHHLTRS